MPSEFEARLTGGHPNSLGNTIEVVESVLSDPSRFDELFNCYFSSDEVVRLRVSNAMKRIAAERLDLLVPYVPRFLDEISQIDQASTQWTLAQLFPLLEPHMKADDLARAKQIVLRNLLNSDDWIVLNRSMVTLVDWTADDPSLVDSIRPRMEALANDPRKSVARYAAKSLKLLTS